MVPSHGRDDGFAMVYALLVVLVVSGIVGIVFATAKSEQDQAAFELDFEDTVHVAEAGAEVFLQRLANNPDDTSGIDGPTATGQGPAAWALAVATAQEASGAYLLDPVEPLIALGEGEAVAIRPSGADANFIYGVGFTPSREAYVNGIGSAYARVVRVQVAFSSRRFSGESALLSGGNLTMNGGFLITGDRGSVHSNGGLKVNGVSGVAEEGISYSGTCTSLLCLGTVVARITGPVAAVPIPEVDPGNVWGTDDALELAAEGLWFDYCAGLWFQRAASDLSPCSGVAMSSPPATWIGTSFAGTSTARGVYFFRDEVDVDISRPNGSITIVTDGDITIGPSASQPSLDGLYPGLFLLAGGDITLQANLLATELQRPALVFANGSMTFIGNPITDNISFVARDSLGFGTTFSGTGIINYDGGAIPDLGENGEPIVVQWDEVR